MIIASKEKNWTPMQVLHTVAAHIDKHSQVSLASQPFRLPAANHITEPRSLGPQQGMPTSHAGAADFGDMASQPPHNDFITINYRYDASIATGAKVKGLDG